MLGQSVGTDVNYGRDIATGQMIEKGPRGRLCSVNRCARKRSRSPSVCSVNRCVGPIRGSRAGGWSGGGNPGAEWGGVPGNYVPLIGRCGAGGGRKYARLIGRGGRP